MEIVSPLIYKKVDLDLNMDIYKTDKVIFDKFTKNIICISDENIKILNKNGTSIKKTLNFSITKDKVKLISLDKLLRYMIVKIENIKLLVINLKSEKVIEMIENENISNLLGIFFIHNMFSNNFANDDIKFSLIYTNKIGYYKINMNKNNTITEIKCVKVSHINSFYYSPDYMVLAIEKKAKIFDFYYLICKKKMVKSHEFIFPLKNKTNERKSTMQKFLSIFSKNSNDEIKNSNIFLPLIDKETLYKKTHFFLEMIYNKLYFMCMNYEESEIQIFHVKSLNTIKLIKNISFDSSKITTLQIIDNLIVIHNFESCESRMIDLKSESQDQLIFKPFPMTNYDILHKNKEMLSELITTKLIYNESESSENVVKVKIEFNELDFVPMVCNENLKFCILYDKFISFGT